MSKLLPQRRIWLCLIGIRSKKHYANIPRAKEAKHEVIVYCKANPDKKIINVIDIVFKQMRKERGIDISK